MLFYASLLSSVLSHLPSGFVLLNMLMAHMSYKGANDDRGINSTPSAQENGASISVHLIMELQYRSSFPSHADRRAHSLCCFTTWQFYNTLPISFVSSFPRLFQPDSPRWGTQQRPASVHLPKMLTPMSTVQLQPFQLALALRPLLSCAKMWKVVQSL